MRRTMKLEVMWMASVLALLFLPVDIRALPLTIPHQAPHYYALVADASLGLWPRSTDEVENPPLSTNGGPADEGLRDALLPSLRHKDHCRSQHTEEEQSGYRKQRASNTDKRQEVKPNSLDLTFHLLREFMEMSRAEKLAQKAFSNKMLLQNIGK